MRKKLGAVVLATVLLLVGCSAMDHGTVIDKKHEDRGVYFCSAKPVILCVDDEDWYVGLQEGEDTGWVPVTHEYYDRVKIGDYYDVREK